MTFLSYSDSPHCGALISRTAEHSPLHISTNPFSPKTLFSRLFWVPLQVYSMFALFTKVAEPEVFYLCQFLLSISTNTYLKVSTRVLSPCCCAVTGKHRVTEHDDLSVSLDWRGTFWTSQFFQRFSSDLFFDWFSSPCSGRLSVWLKSFHKRKVTCCHRKPSVFLHICPYHLAYLKGTNFPIS